jgi:hypothetical protein
MLNLGDIVRPIEGYVANEYLFKIKSKVYTSVPLCKWQYKIERLTAELPNIGNIAEELNLIQKAENLCWDEDELELISSFYPIEPAQDKPQEIKVSGKNLFDDGELMYNYYKNIKEDNKIMKILELYKERKEEAIVKDFEKKEEAILAEDEIQKIIKEMVHQVNSIFENEAREDRLYIDSKNFCQEKTMDKLDELDEEKEDEILQLNKTIEEIEAMFEMTEDYEERMKILKKYGIINKDGKLSI